MWNNSRLFVGFFAIALTSSCKTNSKDFSELKLDRATIDYASLPGVIGLYIGRDHAKPERCTGSIVRDDLILTAAHCLSGTNNQIYPYANLHTTDGIDAVIARGIKSSVYVIHPHHKSVNHRDYMTFLGSDVAFVIFDKGTFSNWGKPVKIASQSPKAGDPVKLIGYGFGWDDDIGYKIGIRRSGTNHITRILPNYAYAIGLQNSWNNKGASPNGGDSGSPLINDAEEILGVLSNEVKSTDLYVNLNDPAVKEFIDAVMKDPTPTGQSGQNLKSISFNNPQNIKNQVIKNNLPTTTDKDDL